MIDMQFPKIMYNAEQISDDIENLERSECANIL